jgi:ArsR family transcriptional regulator, arsenate/arsenite/antimonite-responsive transcriptional repressor
LLKKIYPGSCLFYYYDVCLRHKTNLSMTYKKIKGFEPALQEMAELARVLSHPARLAILQYLAETGTCISGDITGEIPLSRTTVSQHLQELKKAGLIHGTIEGVTVNYCLCKSSLDKLETLFVSFLSGLTKNANTCDESC